MYFATKLCSLTPEHRIDGISNNKIEFCALQRIHLKKENDQILGKKYDMQAYNNTVSTTTY